MVQEDITNIVVTHSQEDKSLQCGDGRIRRDSLMQQEGQDSEREPLLTPPHVPQALPQLVQTFSEEMEIDPNPAEALG